MNPTALYSISADGGEVKHVSADLSAHGMRVAGAMTRSGDATDELFVIIKAPPAIHRINISTGGGLHSSTFRLNVSAFSGIGCAFRGCLRSVFGALGGN
jgi:hypothetical protein